MEMNPIVAALSRLHDRNACLVARIKTLYRVDEIEHSMRQAHDVLRRSTEWSRACHDENRQEPLPTTVTHSECNRAGQRLLVLVGLRFQAQLLAMRDANAQLGEASPYWGDPIWRLHGHHADEREYDQFWRRLPGDYVPPVRKPRNRQSAKTPKKQTKELEPGARGLIEASRENAKAQKPSPTGPGVGHATQGSEIQETCPGHGARPCGTSTLLRSRLRDHRLHPALSGRAYTGRTRRRGQSHAAGTAAFLLTGLGGACLRAA